MSWIGGKERCEVCRFWWNGWFGHMPDVGYCRRHAPIREKSGTDLHREWPTTDAEDKCGDFERSDEADRGIVLRVSVADARYFVDHKPWTEHYRDERSMRLFEQMERALTSARQADGVDRPSPEKEVP